jgi:protease-4
VAIISVDGLILDGLLNYTHKEIDQAAGDNHVKAVVLRINSPGGSISASEDLYQRILRLRDGDKDNTWPAKPLIVSMGSVAASGGYYIAVPAQKIFAESSTTTGSVGVYATYPNFKEIGDKYGVAMNVIKAGEIKDAGSPFKALSEKDRQVLQDGVDEAYVQFLDVIKKGRKKLTREKMLERFLVTPVRPDPQVPGKPPAPYHRYRADGGTFTASRAKDLGLIDAIGTLDDAVKSAASAAGLVTYRAIEYQKPFSLPFAKLLGGQARPLDAGILEPGRLSDALTPRVWYLTPGYDVAAMLAAGDQPR